MRTDKLLSLVQKEVSMKHKGVNIDLVEEYGKVAVLSMDDRELYFDRKQWGKTMRLLNKRTESLGVKWVMVYRAKKKTKKGIK